MSVGSSTARVGPIAVALVLVALVVAASGHWRGGIDVMSLALVGAGAARLLLPRSRVTELAVRHRLFDSIILIGLGVALFILVSIVPTP